MTLTFPNGTTAQLVLTGTNTIASGTTLTSVSGGTSTLITSPTTAIVSNGSATGTGTPVLSTLLSSSAAGLGLGTPRTAYTITVPALPAGACTFYEATWARAGTYVSAYEMDWDFTSIPLIIEPLPSNTVTNNVPLSSRIKICNNPGTQIVQTITTYPIIQNTSTIAGVTVTAGALNFATSQTLELRMTYLASDYLNFLGVTQN